VDGEDALYVASHVYAVDVLAEAEGQAFVDELIALRDAAGAVYAHDWQPGDA